MSPAPRKLGANVHEPMGSLSPPREPLRPSRHRGARRLPDDRFGPLETTASLSLSLIHSNCIDDSMRARAKLQRQRDQAAALALDLDSDELLDHGDQLWQGEDLHEMSRYCDTSNPRIWPHFL